MLDLAKEAFEQRWQREGQVKADGRIIAVHRPANRLSDDERQRLLAVVNAPEFRNLPPSQLDVYSRKIVGLEVFEAESAE